jgi:hypothetical protein
MRWAGHVARIGEKGNSYRLFLGKPGGKRPLGRPTHWWVAIIKKDPLEIECGGVDCICLAKGTDKWRTVVNAVMNLRVPYNASNLSGGYTIGGLSSIDLVS